MRFSFIAIAALLAGAHGDEWKRREERESLMNEEVQDRQLKGMKKSKANDARRAEKQKKGMIREESSAEDVGTKKKKEKKAAKNKLPSEASYGTAEGGAQTPPTRPKDKILLGNKRPVGIARGPDDTMYVTEMLYGGVKKVNVLDGKTEQVVPSYGFRERGARGIVLEQEHLFVAGGGVPDGTPLMVYVYDANNGDEIVACAPGGDEWYLLNDIAIYGEYAYVTDSHYNKLLVMDVAAALEGACKVFSIKTPDQYFLANPLEKHTRANGIVPYANGLLIARTEPGGIFCVDLMDEDLPFMKLAAPDSAPHGIAIDGDILYSAESTENTISYSRLTESPSFESLGTLEASGLDYPTAAAIYDKFLCTVNARIASLPINGTAEGDLGFSEEFYMSCIDRSFDE